MKNSFSSNVHTYQNGSVAGTRAARTVRVSIGNLATVQSLGHPAPGMPSRLNLQVEPGEPVLTAQAKDFPQNAGRNADDVLVLSRPDWATALKLLDSTAKQADATLVISVKDSRVAACRDYFCDEFVAEMNN